MFRKLSASIIVFVFSFVAVGLGQQVSVEVERTNAGPGEDVYLRILLTSDTTLAGLVIPLRISSNPDIVIDSVSFQYTIAAPNFRLQSQITDANRTGKINVIPKIVSPAPHFSAHSGEICRIYLHVLPWAIPASVDVDTTYTCWQVGNQTFCDELQATDTLGTTLLPQFIPGGLSLTQTSATDDLNGEMPDRFSLEQNFPNPFNPETQITFSLSRPGQVRLDVHDITGRWVATLVEGRYSLGEHRVAWIADRHPSGVYVYRLHTPYGDLTRKMLLVK